MEEMGLNISLKGTSPYLIQSVPELDKCVEKENYGRLYKDSASSPLTFYVYLGSM